MIEFDISKYPELFIHGKKINQFLRDCEKNNLLRCPDNETIEKYEEVYSRKFFTLQKQRLVNTIRGIKIKELKDKKQEIISENEYQILEFSHRLEHIREDSEEIKNSLNLIIDPTKITSSTLLGKYIIKICKCLGYDQDKIEIIKNDLFQVNFRNSLSHLDYYFSFDSNDMIVSITWKDTNGTSTTWTYNDLTLPYLKSSTTSRKISNQLKKMDDRISK